jgi:hypothetical protein
MSAPPVAQFLVDVCMLEFAKKHNLKGVSVGLYGFLGGLMYGCIYLLCRKNLFIAYPLIWLMFVM